MKGSTWLKVIGAAVLPVVGYLANKARERKQVFTKDLGGYSVHIDRK